jgi:hypothetical protein
MRGVRPRSGRGPLARWLVRRFRLALSYIAVTSSAAPWGCSSASLHHSRSDAGRSRLLLEVILRSGVVGSTSDDMHLDAVTLAYGLQGRV